MKFSVNQQDLQQALNYCQGVIEKRSTLPILSNILMDVKNSNLTITATDLDLIFIHQINNVGSYRRRQHHYNIINYV
jgi:DNA polymerase-3 subunit beta